MELTAEQLDQIVNAVLEKSKVAFNEMLKEVRKDVVTKEALKEVMKEVVTKDALKDFQTAVSQDFAKTNETVTKIATETETKIKQLQITPADVKKSWWDRELI